MAQTLLAAIAQTLPSETRLQARLRDLDERDRAAVLDHFSLVLPEFDVIIALPDAEALARGLARLRGTPVVLARPGEIPPEGPPHRWTLPTPDPLPDDIQTAVVLTEHLQSGLPELLVALLAARWGWATRAVAAVAERTNDRGRTRLELQGMAVHAAVQLADTPRGLALERRFPHPS